MPSQHDGSARPYRIIADRTDVHPDARIGDGCTIVAREVILGPGTRIGRGSEISCDVLQTGLGCRIGPGCTIVAPQIVLEEGCTIGRSFSAELNERLRLGRHSSIGQRVSVVGQIMEAGEFLWLKDDVVIGGGGARGPRSVLRIGSRSAIFDKCYINLSERVLIGDDTALSANVTLLTHGAWQPRLMGYPTRFAPITIGNNSVVYLNSVVLPGVKIGNYSTVGAHSLVAADVPDYSLVAGTPAKLIKTGADYPRPLTPQEADGELREIFADYVTSLPSKGVEVRSFDHDRALIVAEHEGREESIAYIPLIGPAPPIRGDSIVVCHELTEAARSGRCFLDVKTAAAGGQLTPLAEDLRDFLRRRAIKIFTGEPFRTIPLANLKRLREGLERALGTSGEESSSA